MATGLFQSGHNAAPEKPFINNMNYNTIQGLMTVQGKLLHKPSQGPLTLNVCVFIRYLGAFSQLYWLVASETNTEPKSRFEK